jgi:hypothetical protein
MMAEVVQVRESDGPEAGLRTGPKMSYSHIMDKRAKMAGTDTE